jgi:hypothetical protein
MTRRDLDATDRVLWDFKSGYLRGNFADSEDTDPRRSHPGFLHWCKLDSASCHWNFFNKPEIMWNDMRGLWDSLMTARRCRSNMLKTSKIISLVRECTSQFLFKVRYNRDRSANHNRSEILWIDFADANPWKHNWEEHVFISVSQDGLRWQLTAATEQVRSRPLVFVSFRVHHFTPRVFQEINMCLVCSREENNLWRKSHPVNICQMNSEQILSVLGYWRCIFDLVVILKISFTATIEFPYSTGSPWFIMSFPLSWKRSFFGCCSVAGEPSEHWIAIWPAEFSLKDSFQIGYKLFRYVLEYF